MKREITLLKGLYNNEIRPNKRMLEILLALLAFYSRYNLTIYFFTVLIRYFSMSCISQVPKQIVMP